MQDFAAIKNEVEVSLTRTLLTQIENGGIPYEDAQSIARYILLHIDKVATHNDLLVFIQGLTAKWQMFESLLGLYKMKIKATEETNVQLEAVHDKLSALTNN